MKKIKNGVYMWIYKGYVFKFKKAYGYHPYGLWYVQSGNFRDEHNTMKHLHADIIKNFDFYENEYQLWEEEKYLKAGEIIESTLKGFKK